MEPQSLYCTIYIARHGETEDNLKKLIQGQGDSPLTAQGEQQARDLAAILKNIHFDAIFSSDLGRAKRTAEIVALERQLAVNTAKLLRERSFGRFEGVDYKEYSSLNQELFEKLKSLTEAEKRAFKTHPDEESDDEIASRMLTFLREAAASYLGQRILVVSHGAIMRALLMHLGFGTHDELPAGSLANTGYFVLQSDGVDFEIKETNGVIKHQLN